MTGGRQADGFFLVAIFPFSTPFFTESENKALCSLIHPCFTRSGYCEMHLDREISSL